MNCQHCEAALSEQDRFCPSCGGEQVRHNSAEPFQSNRQIVGYSSKINDPCIAATMKKINSSGMVFTFVLAVVAIIGFTIVGAAEVGGFELPSALFIGLGFGGLLIVIGLFQRARTKRDKTWDGTIIDKTIKQPRYHERRQGNYQVEYTMYVRKEDGSTKKIPCTKDYFDYIQIGDRVRHHAGTADFLFEKYDKSRDSIIYCIVCSSKNDITNDWCHRCKCPLLK